MTPQFDRSAIAAGALLAIVLVVPPFVVSRVFLSENDRASTLVYVLLALILAGFTLGGMLAGWRAIEAPYSNGAVAALSAFVIVQGALLSARVVGITDPDRSIRWAAVVFYALLASSCGAIGGLLADLWERRALDRTVSGGDGR